MKEFIDKLIGRLEEEHERCINRYGVVGGNAPAMEVKQCMAIVNQLAEEHNNESVKGDLICRSDSIEIIEKELSFRIGHDADIALLSVKKQLSELPTAYNDGWIACERELPEKYGEYLCCDTYGDFILGYPTESNTSNTGFVVETDVGFCYDIIAWQPLPAVYKQKGE